MPHHPLSPDPGETLASIGEIALIGRIRRWLGPACPAPPAGIGDDCAVMPARTPRASGLIAVDCIVHGRHIDDSIPPAAAGAKLLKRNLSDFAAMGGRPRTAVVAIACKPTLRLKWLEHFYRGLARCALRYEVTVAGGDLTESDGVFAAALTLVGDAPARVITRRGGRAGDTIYVTGSLGGSRLGRHVRFTPRLAEGQWLARERAVRAMMDVSDGLGKDLPALIPAGCRPKIDSASIPLSAAARRLAKTSGRPPLFHAFSDGEDHELLFILDRKTDRQAFERAWRRKFSTRLTRIGSIERGPAAEQGADALLHGYEHFR